jgi:hypothetical protein
MTSADLQLCGSITFRNLSKSEIAAWKKTTQKTYEGFKIEVDLVEKWLKFECWDDELLYSPMSGQPTFSRDDVTEHVLAALMDEIGDDGDLYKSIRDQEFEINVWYEGLTGDYVDEMSTLIDEIIDEDCETEEELWPALFDKYGVYDYTTKRFVLSGDEAFLYYSDDFNMLDLQIKRAFEIVRDRY